MDTLSKELPCTVLFGNGLNRMTPVNKSWEALLQDVCKEGVSPLDGKIPNTLKYEDIYLADKAEIDTLNRQHGRSDEYKIKWKIAQASLTLESNEYYDRLARLNVWDYLTTNYDACLNRTLEKYDFKLKGYESLEKIYSTYRNCTYQSEAFTKRIWNIHGFAKYPSSIMLGFDQYCGSIAKLKNIQENEHPLTKRLESGQQNIFCWADFFYTTNVHILGFSMDFSETDLWWVLSERMHRIKAKQKKGEQTIHNEIHFYFISEGKDDRSFETLLQSMGVIVHRYKLNKHLRKNVRWVRLYDQIFEEIEGAVGTHELTLPEIAPMF